MFNLVNKRYLFLIISLIVIIPGTLSLIFKGLNVGIDFAGGSSLQFRPSQHVSTTSVVQIKNMLDGLGLKDSQVNIGDDTGTPGNQVAWIELNTIVDKNVQTTIQTDLDNHYGKGVVFATPDPLQITRNGKTTSVTVVTIVSKSKTVVFKESDLKAALGKLPNTTNATSPTPPAKTATPAPVSPAVSPTATTKATATTTATATATPTSTPTTNPAANIPVHIANVQIGGVTDTVNILTSTTTTNDAPIRAVQSAFLSDKSNFLSKSGIYLYLMSNSSVSGSVASDTIRNSILAVIAASVLILLYVAFAFRKVQKPWRYGICAIIALLHDVLVVLGIFSILGWIDILGWAPKIQIDALFITALLTVVGFSVHDTIVVFDRIRENMQRRSAESFEQVVNASLVQTMSRSLNTSLTVLFTLSALTLFGGDSIRTFTFALLIGIFSGTYSSIFNASMLLVIWERGELGLWRFNREKRMPDGRTRREVRERELARSRG